MYDKELALDSLYNIESALGMIAERADVATTPDDFLLSPDGMLRLDAICMNLIALGEAVKGLDKITKGELLPRYPEIYWSGVMKMRDKIAHHYFEMDAEVVFKTLKEDIPMMLPVVQRMIKEVNNSL
ncbi:HepT-like ribonuclease domain-containing protein [Bacteroides fluxus]